MKKYYFLSYYKITRFGSTFESDVYDKHPFELIKEMQSWEDNVSYTLISYQEITKNEYDFYLGEADNVN